MKYLAQRESFIQSKFRSKVASQYIIKPVLYETYYLWVNIVNADNLVLSYHGINSHNSEHYKL